MEVSAEGTGATLQATIEAAEALLPGGATVQFSEVKVGQCVEGLALFKVIEVDELMAQPEPTAAVEVTIGYTE